MDEHTQTMGQLLLQGIRQAPSDRVALRWYEREGDGAQLCELTFGELLSHMGHLAQAFSNNVAGDGRVALVMDRSGIDVVALLTLLCTNYTAVLLSPDETPEQLQSKLKRGGAVLLMSSRPSDAACAAELSVTYWSYAHVRDLMQASPVALEVEQSPDDQALLIFTSGTTGTNKCVVRTQRNVASTVEGNAATLYYGSEQLQVLPAHHGFGIENLLATLAQGLTLTLSRGMRHWVGEIARYRVENLFAAPAQLDVLAELLAASQQQGVAPKDIALRYAVTGSAAFPQKTVDALGALGVQVVDAYGSSEGGAIAYPVFGTSRYLDSTGSSGWLRPCLEWRLRNANASGVGELMLRGASVSPGYLGTNGALEPLPGEDGWYATGDLARVSDEGLVSLVGRVKDLIILASGENVSPAELEETFGAVTGVRECLALEYGGSIRLLVVPDGDNGDADALARGLFAANAQLPSWKRVGAFYLSGPLPRTANGKLRRVGATPDEAARIALPQEGGQEGGTLGAVLGAFRDALGEADADPDDDFFALGGDSLSGMEVVTALRNAGYELAFHDIFDHPTVRDLAGFLERCESGAAHGIPHAPELEQIALGQTIAPGIDQKVVSRIVGRFAAGHIEAIYPAMVSGYTDVRVAKHVLHALNGYFLDRMIVLRQPLEERDFSERVRSIVQRHPVLRSAWFEDDETWYQVVLADGAVPAFYEDRRALPGSEAQKLQDVLGEYRLRYVRREREEIPNMFGVWCHRLTETSCVLIVELTHLCADGFSEELLLRELVQGPDPEREDNYHRYRLWCNDQRGEGDHDFWDGCSKTIEEGGFQPHAGADGKARRGIQVTSWHELFPIRLDDELSAFVRAYAQAAHVTVAEVLEFAYYRAYMELYGLDRILFAEFLSGRESTPFDARDTFGYLVVRVPCWLSGSDGIEDFHARRAELMRHAPNAQVSFLEPYQRLPYLVNTMLFDESWRRHVQSVVSLQEAGDRPNLGNDILVAYIRQFGNTYRFDVLHSRSKETVRMLEALEKNLKNTVTALSLGLHQKP